MVGTHPRRRFAGVVAGVAALLAIHVADAAGASTVPVSLDELLARAEQDALYDDPRWLALLHFERGHLGIGLRSRARTPSFFLAPDGARDARAELRATLRAFFDPDAIVRDGEHAQCAFIARRHWLEGRLGLAPDALRTVSCDAYDRWHDGLGARGLTLVFPEGFMGNPASLFGHTLLRIDTGGDGGGEDLLASSVDFTAHAGEDAIPVYVAKGVFGFYPGVFRVRPYYQQLKRYADWENRDIWEYRLDVEPGELEFLLMHLWEVRGAEFPYYFVTKNCSYELLRLLEIGVPNLDLSRRFRTAVLPIDTVRAVAYVPGFVVGEPRYRAAPETRVWTARRTLPRADRRLVQSIVERRVGADDETVVALPAARRARVLDIAYEQLRYQFLAGQVSDEESRSLSRRILMARSQVRGEDVRPEPITVPVPSVRPEEGHESSRLSVTGGWRDDEPFVDLELRPFFQGLLDDDGGFTPHMQIRFLDTRVRIYPDDGEVRLQTLTLLDVVSLSPRDRVFRPWAWSLATGLRTRRVPRGDDLDDAPVWGTEVGRGLAVAPHERLLLYGLAEGRLDVGPALDGDVSFGGGGRAGGYLGSRGAPGRLHVFAEATRFFAGETTTWLRGGAEARLTTTRNSAIVAHGSGNRIHGVSWFEGGLRMDLFF